MAQDLERKVSSPTVLFLNVSYDSSRGGGVEFSSSVAGLRWKLGYSFIATIHGSDEGLPWNNRNLARRDEVDVSGYYGGMQLSFSSRVEYLESSGGEVRFLCGGSRPLNFPDTIVQAVFDESGEPVWRNPQYIT